VKLLEEIIELLTDGKTPLADVLRKCFILAYTLKNEPLKKWIECELQGYESDGDLPPYRNAKGASRGHFFGPFGSSLSNQPLPPALLNPEHRYLATDIRLRQPIAAYDRGDEITDAAINWPQDMVVMYQEKFYDHMALSRAWIYVPASVIRGLVDNVRTRLLKFLLEIKAELPENSLEGAESIPPSTVDRLVNVTILGGNNVIGNVESFNAPTVLAGDLVSLKASLRTLVIEEDELTAIEAAMQDDGTYAISPDEQKTIGRKTLDWIKDASKTASKKGLEISGAVLEEAIKRSVFGYLGF